MPNWCECELDVRGEWERLQQFKEEVQEVCRETIDGVDIMVLSFNKIVPRPAEVDWYTWNIKNWGTKWNAHNVICIEHKAKNIIAYDFATAWTPPLPVIAQASVLYPDLIFTLRYWEGGIGFRGHVKYKGGVLVKNSHFDNYKGGRGG